MRKLVLVCTSVFAAVAASALVPSSRGVSSGDGEIRLIPMPESAVHHDPRVRESGMREGTSHECAYMYGQVAPRNRIRRLSTGSAADTPNEAGAP